MKHLKLIALCLGVACAPAALVLKFSNSSPINQPGGLMGQIQKLTDLSTHHDEIGLAGTKPVKTAEFNSGDSLKWVEILRKSVLGKDKAAIDRSCQALIKSGPTTIKILREALIKETDTEVATLMTDVLTSIGTSGAYVAALEAATLSENKEVKYAVLDRLKGSLNQAGIQAITNLVLTSTGELQETAANFMRDSANPDLLSELIHSATTPEQRTVVAGILSNSLSPSTAKFLQECVNLPDEMLARAAMSGLAAQATDRSLTLLLNSLSASTPTPARQKDVVDAALTMLKPGQLGFVINLEAFASTSPSSQTRILAIQTLAATSQTTPDIRYAMLFKYLPYEKDPLVIPVLQKALASLSPNISQAAGVQN